MQRVPNENWLIASYNYIIKIHWYACTLCVGSNVYMHLYLFHREEYAIMSSETNCQGVNKESHNECVGVIWGNFIAIMLFRLISQDRSQRRRSHSQEESQVFCFPWCLQSITFPGQMASLEQARPIRGNQVTRQSVKSFSPQQRALKTFCVDPQQSYQLTVCG